MSEPARLAGVYFSPGAAMADIVARPQRWFIPLILVMVVQLIFMNQFGKRVGWERAVRQQIENNSQIQQLPPEKKQEAIDRGVKIGGTMAYVGAIAGPPVVAVIMAGILMFVMNAMGGAARFVQSLAIVCYGSLINLLAGVLAIGVLFLKNPEDFDIQNPLAFNVGAFVPETAPKWLAALGSSLDVFSFWSMAVLAFGYAATSRKMTWGKALTGILGLWAVVVVCKVGWRAMFG